MLVKQLESGRAEVENQYVRSVTRAGNEAARRRVLEVFEVANRKWRGIGEIAQSGYRLRPEYAAYDAEKMFGVETTHAEEPAECMAPLRAARPGQAGALPGVRHALHTRDPLGAPMVSSEGACAAYYQYRRHV